MTNKPAFWGRFGGGSTKGLITALHAAETRHRYFNRYPLTPSDLRDMAKHDGVLVVEDSTIPNASSFWDKRRKRPIILCPTNLSYVDTVLSLGHELGHIWCGHVLKDGITLHYDKHWASAKSKNERDANFVAFQSLIPARVPLGLLKHQIPITGDRIYEEMLGYFGHDDVNAAPSCLYYAVLFRKAIDFVEKTGYCHLECVDGKDCPKGRHCAD